MIAGDDRGAAAEPAERLAKRQVEIEGKRQGAIAVGTLQMVEQRARRIEIPELHRRRIRRVARRRDVVFADKIEVDGNHGRRRTGEVEGMIRRRQSYGATRGLRG